MRKRYLWAVSGGHAVADMAQGSLPAMLPFIIVAGGLNYTQAAGLTFAVALASSMTQPIFGIMADKLTKSWLLPLGVLLSCGTISLIGLFSDYYWLMFIIGIVSGIGVAAYHPEGARMANRLSGEKKGGGMSIFSVGGNAGFAIGPLIATIGMLTLGLRGSIFLAILPVFMCILLFNLNPKMYSLADATEKKVVKVTGEQDNEWGKFSWLSVSIVSRSIISHCLNTFLPLYWMNVLLQSQAASGLIVSYMLSVGVFATLLSGYLADRIGPNNVIKIGFLVLLPSTFFLTYTDNPYLAMLLLIPIAGGNFFTSTTLTILGQKYLPKNIGFASGITLGLGVSIGGLITPLFGSYADIHGLTATLRLLAFMPLLGLLVAFTIKNPGKKMRNEG